MSKPNMGKILNPNKEYTRDATHVPVVPVIAEQSLSPGQKVNLYRGKIPSRENIIYATPAFQKSMGVVDPFIETVVQAGDKFYCWIKPNTVKELWHEWRHTFFD